MKKEEALKVSSLTKEEKERIEAAYEAARRTGRKSPLESMASGIQVKSYAKDLVVRHQKKLEAKARREKNELLKNQKIQEIIDLVKQAINDGMNINEVIQIFKDSIRARHNKSIEEKIEALKKQLI